MIFIPASINLLAISAVTDEPEIWPTGEKIIDSLVPNVWTLVAHVVASIIILLIIIKLVWKPLKRFVSARQALIQSNIDEASRSVESARTDAELALQNRHAARLEAESLVASATASSRLIRDEILATAQIQSNLIRKNAEEQIQKNENRLRTEMSQLIIDNSIELTKKVLNKKLTTVEHEALVNDFINSLSSETIT